MTRHARFLADDDKALWRAGDVAEFLGRESNDFRAPPIYVLRLADGQEIALHQPVQRGLIAILADPKCGFCQGGSVGNAESWTDGKPRPPASCPRCGGVGW